MQPCEDSSLKGFDSAPLMSVAPDVSIAITIFLAVMRARHRLILKVRTGQYRFKSMSNNEIRNFSALENSASTARVLNLRKVFVNFGHEDDYKKSPFFINRTLNRSLILKHRLRGDERDDFTEFRSVATKIVVPIDVTDLKMGALCVFVGQRNFEKMLSNSLNKTELELQRDLEILRKLDSVPTLDPFLLRENLEREGIKPANCYFQITEADIIRMLSFVEAEIGALVRMSFGNDGNAEQASVLTKKLLSNSGAADTDALRLTLHMDHIQYREGIFCWKAFLYYKWQLGDLLPKAKNILSEIESVVPRGKATSDEKKLINDMRANISRSFSKSVKNVTGTLAIYDNAYYMLTQKSDPQVFKNFLLSAPELFRALGERLGAMQHLLTFWRYRVPEGTRPQMDAEELIDIFGDFENSLDGGNQQEETANPKIDLTPSA